MRGTPPQPPPDPNDVKAAAEGTTAFAADLHGQLRAAAAGNLLVSPYSIGTALAMIAAGSRGNTFDELRKVLRLPAFDKLGAAFRGLAERVTTVPRAASSRSELAVANAIWAQDDHPWEAAYLARVQNDFHGALFGVDFRTAADTVGVRVNHWVEERTRGRIRNLIPPGAFGRETRVVLTNAIYFKARWANVFDKQNTRREDFITPTIARVKAPLMYQRGTFALRETDALQVLRLPYTGYATSMYVLLPRTPDGLPDLEQRLTGSNLTNWTTGSATTDVKVWLPKFRFGLHTQLSQSLKALGVVDAFDPNKADFKGMTDHPEGLFVSDVIHEACVEVDEVGTEAAAATGGWGAGGYAGPRGLPPPPKEFRADHPFLFVIKHEETGAVLFLGRVLDPTK